MSLLPCTHCRRHVESTVAVCPFCGEALALAAPVPRLVNERLRRSALVALGASAMLVGCSSTDSGVAPPYGVAPYDSAVDTTPADAGVDVAKDTDTGTLETGGADTSSDTSDAAADTREIGIAPPYGIPPSDGG